MELTARLSFILHFILFYFYFLAAPKSQGLAHICHTRYITHLFLNSKLLQIIRKLNESATHHVKSLLRIFSWRKQKKMHRPDPFLHRKYPKATGTTLKFQKQFKLIINQVKLVSSISTSSLNPLYWLIKYNVPRLLIFKFAAFAYLIMGLIYIICIKSWLNLLYLI